MSLKKSNSPSKFTIKTKLNIINNTNLENFPLGYFRVYEFDYFRLPKEDAPDGYFD